MADVKGEAQKLATGTVKKVLKKYGFGFLIEAVPWLGSLWPGLTIRVWKELNGNITGPEGILMLPIAAFFDLAGFIIFAIEVWVDLGIIATIINWLGFSFIFIWIYLRSGSVLGKEAGGEKSNNQENSPEEILELEENSDGTYKIKPKEGTEKSSGSQSSKATLDTKSKPTKPSPKK